MKRDELGQPLGLEPGRSLPPAKPRPDRRRVGERRAGNLRLAHRDPLQQPAQEVGRGHRRWGAGRRHRTLCREGRSHPLRRAVVRRRPERLSPAASSPVGSQRPARISIATVHQDTAGSWRFDRGRRRRRRPERLACFPRRQYPYLSHRAKSGSTPPEAQREALQKPGFRGSRVFASKDDLERSWTIRGQLRRGSQKACKTRLFGRVEGVGLRQSRADLSRSRRRLVHFAQKSIQRLRYLRNRPLLRAAGDEQGQLLEDVQ